MSRQDEEYLMEALELLEQGMPAPEILARYPESADSLGPLLAVAVDLSGLAKPASQDAAQTSKGKFLQQAAQPHKNRRAAPAVLLRRLVGTSLALLLILFWGLSMAAISAADAVPGDTLYGSKLFLESVRLNYSPDPQAAADMIEDFRQERVNEVLELLSQGRQELVTFSGTVEQITPDRWLVAGVPVAVLPATAIQGAVEVGYVVQVKGKTAEGAVAAELIEVVDGRSPVPAPDEPSPRPAPSALPAPTATPIDTPEPAGVREPVEEPLPALTFPAPSPTASQTDDSSDGEEIEQPDSGEPAGDEAAAGAGEEQQATPAGVDGAANGEDSSQEGGESVDEADGAEDENGTDKSDETDGPDEVEAPNEAHEVDEADEVDEVDSGD